MTLRPTRMKLLVFLSLLTSGCSSLLYYPTHNHYFDPAQTGFAHEDVWLTSFDGRKVHGWYFISDPHHPPKAVITFFHGNGENLTSHFAALAWILPYHYDFFIFDYQGYGESEGSPSPQKTVEDGCLALRYIKGRSPHVPQIVYGQSLGGAVALRSVIETKNDVPLKLILIDSSFASYQSAARHVLSHSWVTWLFQPLAYVLMSDKWAPQNQLREIAPVPLIVMHGDQDQVVDFEMGKELFDLAQEPKAFWQVERGRHTDAFWRHGETYKVKFLNRIETALKTPAL